MINTPAHKQTDPAKAPGQIRTLGDYINQINAGEPKKLTFEEWWAPHEVAYTQSYIKNMCHAAWVAAQRNV